jgi:hypothetical protein
LAACPAKFRLAARLRRRDAVSRLEQAYYRNRKE